MHSIYGLVNFLIQFSKNLLIRASLFQIPGQIALETIRYITHTLILKVILHELFIGECNLNEFSNAASSDFLQPSLVIDDPPVISL